MSAKETKSKKKTVGKRGKKGIQPPAVTNDLTNVDRTFFELTINDLNNKLSRLRSQLIASEEKNYNLSTKLQVFEEARDDITSHLQRVLIQRNDLVAQHEETIQNLKDKNTRETTAASAIIHDLELQYKEMKTQLTSEIKLQKGQLRSLSEFRRLRDILYDKYDEMRAEDRERDREHEEQVFELQQKTVVERDSLRRDIENNLIQVAKDFTLSNEIRNAGYTRRLIRENVALQKEIEKLVEAQAKMQQELVQHLEKSKSINEEYAILKEVQSQLIQSGQNKIHIIEKLTDNYEHLKKNYIEILRYRNLYEHLMKKDKCESHYVRDMTIKLRVLDQSIISLKLEKSRLLSTLQQKENEINKLKQLIQQIKNAIEVVIVDSSTKKSDTGEGRARRFNLLLHLMDIITRHSNTMPQTKSLMTLTSSQESIYHKGHMGLIPPQNVSLMEIFKRGPAINSSATETEGLVFEILSSESKIIPKERFEEAGSIVDVEWGSTLYISSSHEDLEVLPVEDDRDDIIAEDGSTSSFQSTHAIQIKKIASSVVIKTDSNIHQNSPVSAVTNGSIDKYSVDISTTSAEHRLLQSYSDDGEFSVELFY